MPRRHKREKQKQKSLPIKIQNRKKKKEEEKERLAKIDPAEKQAEFVCRLMYPDEEYTFKFDKDLDCVLALDDKGIIRRSFCSSEILRKWKWYKGRFLAKNELVQEIIDAFEDMKIEDLVKTLDRLRPRPEEALKENPYRHD